MFSTVVSTAPYSYHVKMIQDPDEDFNDAFIP
jgi:hypothetical protein